MYIPGFDATLVSFDYSSMHVWKKNQLIKSMDVSGSSGALGGINHWIYLPKWRIIAISTNHLELKVIISN